MHEQDLAIVKGLVSMAWADGSVTNEEREVIEALLQAFNASPSERRELEIYRNASQRRTIDDVPVTELSYDDRRVLLQHAVLIAHADGEHGDERSVFWKCCARSFASPTWRRGHHRAGDAAREGNARGGAPRLG